VYGAAGGGALIIHDEQTGAQESIRVPIAAAHGIAATTKSGTETLWIADPGPEGGTGQVLEVGMNGQILTHVDLPHGTAPRGWRPTAVVPAPDGTLWIADGYGQNLLYRLTPDGATQVIDSAEGLAFDCPHGLTIDSRGPVPRMALADRANRRIVFLNMDGTVDRVVTDERLRAPSCLAITGDQLVVTDLLGAIASIDRSDRIEVKVGTALEEVPAGWPNRVVNGETVAPVLADGVLHSPHGVAATDSGDVYLTEWSFGGRVERIRWSE
jgi:hypothetical protein